MTSLLEVHDLVKTYRGVRAVDGISFRIPEGNCFGLLGPNGAGKTTTVEILEGITPYDSGQILYRGAPPGRAFRNEAGIMFQHTALQEHVTVREVLHMFASLYPRTMPLEELVEVCDLQEFLDRDTHRVSGGQRQRVLLAVALINDPCILFMDEPTTGLDPQARHRFWELVERIKAQGRTLVLTTHYMEEAYRLCDELIILDHGHIIAEGTPDALLAAHYQDTILRLPAASIDGVRNNLKETVLDCGEHVEILTPDVDDTLRELQHAGVRLNRLEIRERTLEDLFLELTERRDT
ncbi:MAG: ABC transporter ATP-binding protein [Gammaproteobacteria bacterium]